MKDLFERIKEKAEFYGVAFCGVANLADAKNFIQNQGGKLVGSLPRAISIGIRLPDTVVDQLPRRKIHANAANYRIHAYNVINRRLDLIISHLSGILQDAGYRALPVPASDRMNKNGLFGIFSHKLAAHLAGFGWIGRSCLLVTPEFGPRVRWASILTDAPLTATGSARDPECGECNICVDNCPVHAFTGNLFHITKPREDRYDAQKCQDYFDA